jgi:hypothetical protein
VRHQFLTFSLIAQQKLVPPNKRKITRENGKALSRKRRRIDDQENKGNDANSKNKEAASLRLSNNKAPDVKSKSKEAASSPASVQPGTSKPPAPAASVQLSNNKSKNKSKEAASSPASVQPGTSKPPAPAASVQLSNNNNNKALDVKSKEAASSRTSVQEEPSHTPEGWVLFFSFCVCLCVLSLEHVFNSSGTHTTQLERPIR